MVIFVALAMLAAVALGGWTNEWLHGRRLERLLEDAEHDRDVALGWVETQIVDDAVVYPTLHAVDGGEA